MNSKKRKSAKRNSNEEYDDKKKKHPGGPLQRKGGSAESWNDAVGESLEVIPINCKPNERF